MIIIGNADVMSEHLILSADDFVPITNIGKNYLKRRPRKTENHETKAAEVEEEPPSEMNLIDDTRTNQRADRILDTLKEYHQNLLF